MTASCKPKPSMQMAQTSSSTQLCARATARFSASRHSSLVSRGGGAGTRPRSWARVSVGRFTLTSGTTRDRPQPTHLPLAPRFMAAQVSHSHRRSTVGPTPRRRPASAMPAPARASPDPPPARPTLGPASKVAVAELIWGGMLPLPPPPPPPLPPLLMLRLPLPLPLPSLPTLLVPPEPLRKLARADVLDHGNGTEPAAPRPALADAERWKSVPAPRPLPLINTSSFMLLMMWSWRAWERMEGGGGSDDRISNRSQDRYAVSPHTPPNVPAQRNAQNVHHAGISTVK
jgi:hypothetical protein